MSFSLVFQVHGLDWTYKGSYDGSNAKHATDDARVDWSLVHGCRVCDDDQRAAKDTCRSHTSNGSLVEPILAWMSNYSVLLPGTCAYDQCRRVWGSAADGGSDFENQQGREKNPFRVEDPVELAKGELECCMFFPTVSARRSRLTAGTMAVLLLTTCREKVGCRRRQHRYCTRSLLNGWTLTRPIPSNIFETAKLVRDARDGGCDDGVVQGDAQRGDAQREYAEGESETRQVRRLSADRICRLLLHRLRRVSAGTRKGTVLRHVGGYFAVDGGAKGMNDSGMIVGDERNLERVEVSLVSIYILTSVGQL